MERPILMTTESVKAILDGRKTMTRRVVKLRKPSMNPRSSLSAHGGIYSMGDSQRELEYYDKYGPPPSHCPYGQVGDRLWVRETWAIIKENDNVSIIDMSQNSGLYYKADMPLAHGKWRPSIFMPRWASRLTLEITGVRVERLQEISHQDAYKEGCKVTLDEFQAGCSYIAENYREHFIRLWDSLNAKRGYGWETNPWVWVIKFDNIGVRVK